MRGHPPTPHGSPPHYFHQKRRQNDSRERTWADLRERQAKSRKNSTLILGPFAARFVGHHATRVTTNPGIRDARQRFEELKAQKLELEIAVTEGRLIDRQAVTDTGVRLLTEIREAFLRLGRRVADQAVGKDAREIARLVESEARTILEDLADEKRFFARLQEDALS